MTCQDYPTPPGVRHVYTFNPIEEFVHSREDHVDDAWESYMTSHPKEYMKNSTAAYERLLRKETFRQNIR